MSKGNRKRRVEAGILARPKCTARKTNGEPCPQSPVSGATVCWHHGGAAPQVRRKAAERLAKGVPDMLRALKELALNEDYPPAVRLAAIRDWLDRAGIDRKIEIDITSSTFEQMIAGVIAEVEDGTPMANLASYESRMDNGRVIPGELADE